jgi:hypothetical protein
LDADEVLPAHEYRFRGLRDRVADLQAHHEQRLAELLAMVTAQPGVTTWQLAEQVPWRRPWAEITGVNRRAAVGETLAHLRLLASRGKLLNSAGDIDQWTVIPGRPDQSLAASGRAGQHPME